MHTLIVIPARFGSVRLPGKPLLKIGGEPLVHLVIRNVLSFGIDADIVVATDDIRVEETVAEVGVRPIATSTTHRSGTERIAEIVRGSDFADVELILNVQGDQPFLPRDAAVGSLNQIERGYPLGTAAAPLERHHESNPNRVKVAVDSAGRALVFARTMPNPAHAQGQTGVFLHVGVYAYTRAALLDWVSLPANAEEYDEGLEQLRPLLNGTPIGVALLREPVEPGVDTLDDLDRASLTVASTRTGT